MITRQQLSCLLKSLLPVSLLFFIVGCATITDVQPENPANYAEVDVKITTDGLPEVTIYNVALFTGFSTKYFFTSLGQTKPDKLFLSPGTYLVRMTCYGSIYVTVDESDVDIIPEASNIYVQDGTPELKVTVRAGKKYWLGCKNQSDKDTLYLDEQ